MKVIENRSWRFKIAAMKSIHLIIFIALINCMSSALAEGTTKTEIYAKRGDRELEIHLHFPEGWKATDKRPGMIFFFGGGWKDGSTNQLLPQAVYFASRGIVTARADYRVLSRDGVTPDQCVEDARTAVRWMKQNAAELGIDPDKMISSGASAGGHLAACTMIVNSVDAPDDDVSISPVPAAMVLFNPCMSFEPDKVKERLGDKEHLWIKISPADNITTQTPPSIDMFGTNDQLLVLADLYREPAAEKGVRVEKYLAEGQDHGFFNDSPWLERTLIAADEFLISQGLLTGSPTVEDPGGNTDPIPPSGKEKMAEVWKKLDINNNGRIERSEAKGRIAKHFDRVDANGDGAIDKQELGRAAKKASK